MNDNDALIFGTNTRITVSIEPEAAAMLDELIARLYPTRRSSQARAEIVEQGIRMVYRRTVRK